MVPGLDLNVVFRKELLSLYLLVEGMRFDLVHSGHHFVMDNEVHYTVGMKVADADGLDPTLAIKFLHRAPRAKNIPIRLMNEVEVKIVEPQTLQRAVDRSLRLVETSVRDP